MLNEGIKFVKKYSPEILLALGMAGTGATVYATYKKSPQVNAYLDTVDERVEKGEEVSKKEIVKEVAKEMAIPAVLGIASFTAIVTSYKIQKDRIIGLSTAFASASLEYKAFQKRVVKEIGEEKFRQLMAPTKKKEITTVDKKGKEKKVIEDVKTKGNLIDGVWFSESDEYARDSHEYNMQYVDSVISQLELISFNKNGIVLNEVLEAFGMNKTRQGALLGWSDGSFNITKEIVYIYNEESQMREPQIYIHWSQPEYVYQTMSYDNAYYLA